MARGGWNKATMIGKSNGRRSDGGAGEDFVTIVAPVVEERGFGAVEVFEEREVGALR